MPCFFNGLGRGTLPADHQLAFLRTRSALKQRADVVVVIGTPLDFRLGFGRFGEARSPTSSTPSRSAPPTSTCRRSPATSPPRCGRWPSTRATGATTRRGSASCATPSGRRRAAEAPLLAAADDPIKPTRVYGELRKRLARDAVVICDGGDFASYAGKYVEVLAARRAGSTPGRTAASATGSGYSIAARVARPDAQIVALLGDGAAGFSLMDADTLVRHDLPVVMVVGNNGMWGLEKHPMQAIYGWDVACDLQPGAATTRSCAALGGAGEIVRPSPTRSAPPSTGRSPAACHTSST